MKSIFVSGSDTGIGKTWAVAALASLLVSRGSRVQVVKPVQTGVSDQDQMDVQCVLARCDSELLTGRTLRSFAAPVAPLYAAELEGMRLSFDELVDEVRALPDSDYRIIEGAGSMAVPIDADGRDWGDFASALSVDATALVVEDRVGAIGQARMLFAYATSKKLKSGLWLNERRAQSDRERQSTRSGIKQLRLPFWAEQNKGDRHAIFLRKDWL